MALLTVPLLPKAQQTLTVCNGTQSNANVPIDGYNTDYYYKRSQFIIPADSLTAMVGKSITEMTFYNTSTNSKTCAGLDITIKLGSTSDAAFSSAAFDATTTMTTVYQGALDMVSGVETFQLTTDYTYQGGNLLVEVYNQQQGCWFGNGHYGCTMTANTAVYGSDDSAIPTAATATATFLPKVSFVYETPSTCPRPMALHIADVSSSDITIAWTAAQSSDNQWIVSNGTTTDIAYDTFYTFSNLTPSTEYTFVVRTYCGSGDTSNNVTVSGLTACATVTELPWSEGFENTTSVNCFSIFDLDNNTSDNWTVYNSTTGGAHGGTHYATTSYNSSTNANDWLITPAIELPSNANDITLEWYAQGSAYNSYQTSMTVLISTTGAANENAFTDTIISQVLNDGWNSFATSLLNYAGETVNIAFIHDSYNDNGLSIDDISIYLGTACMAPQQVAVSNISSSSADITVSDMLNTDNYRIYLTDGTNTDSVDIIGTTHTFTNLVANTVYTVSAATLCNGTPTTTVTTSFRTLAGDPIDNLPYYCDFEDDDINSLWVLENGTQTNTWRIGSLVNNTEYGEKALYIADNDTAAAYNVSSASSVFAYTVFAFSAGDYAISYDWHAKGEVCCDYLRVAVLPASIDVTAGSNSGWSNTALPNGAIAADGGSKLNDSVNFNTFNGSFSIPTADTYKLVFFWRNDYSGGTQPPAAIDNIEISQLECSQPLMVSTTDILSDEITLYWQPAGSETNWLVSNGVDTAEAFDTFYVFQGLNPATTYNFSVAALCSSGDTSLAVTTSATTSCTSISQFPYNESFENPGTWNCWTVYDLDNSTTNNWRRNESTTYSHTGSFGAHATYNSSQNANDWLVSAPIEVPDDGEDYSISWWTLGSTYSNTYHSGLAVMVSTTNNSVASFTDTLRCDTLADSWTQYIAPLSAYAGQTIYVAFVHNSYNDNGPYIDDISIYAGEACIAPQALTVSALTTSATVTVTDSNLVGNYHLVISDGTFIDSVDIQSNTYTFNNLTPGTLYTLTVATICDNGNSTTISTQFSTQCEPITQLPWSDDFETWTTGSNSPMAACWDRAYYEVDGTLGNASNRVYATTYSGAKCLYMYSNCNASGQSSKALAILPAFDNDINELTISFKMRYSTSNPASECMELGVVAADGSFAVIDTLTHPANNQWNTYERLLGDYTGNAGRLAFRYTYRQTSDYWYGYIDSIVVDLAPECARPTSVAVSNVTTTSANLAIVDPNNAGSYRVWIASANTIDSADVNGYSYSFTNLAPATVYNVSVATICPNGLTAPTTTSFTTGCAPFTTLPWLEDFETWATGSNSAMAPCWNREYYEIGGTLGNASNRVYATTNSGTKCLYMYSLCDANGASSQAVAILPEFDTTIADLMVSFSVKFSTSYATRERMEIGVMTANGFVAFDTVQHPGNNSWFDWETNFFGYAGANGQIAFRYTYMYASDYWYGYLDNITVELAPACPRPSGINVTNITETSATITIVDPAQTNNYIVIVGTDTIYSTSATINLTNLSSSMAYNVAAASVCADASVTSFYTTSFRTLCGTIVEFPYYEPFDSEAAIGCWNIWDMDAYSNDDWTYGSTSGSMSTGFNADEAANDWLITPAFALPSNTADFTFSWRVTGNSYSSDMSHLTVLLSTTGTDSAECFTDTLYSATLQDTWDSIAVSLAPYGGQTIHIAFIHDSYNDDGPELDDVRVNGVGIGGSCAAPSGVALSSVTYQSADFVWSSSAAAFEVGYANSGSSMPSTTNIVTTNTCSVSGLAPATNYVFFVRAICSEGDTSNWASLTFTTDSLPCFDPTELAVQATGYTTVTLGWTANGEETNWRIHVWNTAFDTTYDVNTNPATVGGLAPDVDYSAEVMALCGAVMLESGVSNTVTFHTAMCEVPTGVTVNNVTAHTAVVSWTGTAQSYRVTYGYEGFGTGNEIAAIPVTGTTTTLTGLESGETYDVYVYAVCETGIESNASTKQTFETDIEGISTADGMNVSIYPNPTTDATTIALSGVNGEVSITIVDMNGRIVKSDSMSCEGDCTKRMEVEGLAQGAYFVRINGEGLNMVKKLVVK